MFIGIDYTAAVRQRAGIGRYTRELMAALLALESPHQYVLFAATGGIGRQTSSVKRQASSVKFRTIPISDEWMARLWHRLRLPIPVEAITGPLDVFYSPDFLLPPTHRSTRTLLTVHDLSFLRYPEAFVPKLRRYLERLVPRSIARADVVLADSAATQADIVSLLGVPPDKVQVLYSGVHPCFRPEAELGERDRLQARYGIGGRPYVLSVGTVQPRKNYIRLIKAFTRLQTCNLQTCKLANLQLADLQLLIAGGRGWLYQDIFAEAEKQGDSVRLLGFVDEADLPALYRNAVLFAFPSLYEGFGLPVLEAMACGVPVVCSDASSLPEVAGDAALLVDPHDEDALAEAMARGLGDAGLRREMITRGLAQATRFTWEQAARQLVGIFDVSGTRINADHTDVHR